MSLKKCVHLATLLVVIVAGIIFHPAYTKANHVHVNGPRTGGHIVDKPFHFLTASCKDNMEKLLGGGGSGKRG
jgi:hypothetical protein